MAKNRTLFLSFVLFTACLVTAGEDAEEEQAKVLLTGHKVIRVTPRTKEQVDFLVSLLERDDGFNIDFWIEPAGVNSPADIHLSPEFYTGVTANLTRAGMAVTVQIEDLQDSLDKQNPGARMFGGFSYDKYHTYDEIVGEMKKLVSQFSNLATMFTFGKSYQGREQWAVKIQAKRSTGRKTFLVHCGIHAREWVTQATCIYMINKMLNNYGRDSDMTSILDKMDWIIMPVFNPDGYVQTWTSNRMWRKTVSPNSGSRCRGSDPNRNWGYKWGGIGTSRNPCSDTYPGSRPFSEIETLNVARYMFNHRQELVGYMDIHAYSQLWMTPWGYKRTRPRDYQEMESVSRAATNALYNAGYSTRYRVGPSSVIIYATTGGSTDWAYGVLGIKYSFALELRDTGRYGFALPANQIVPTASETLAGIIAMAKQIKM